MVRAEKNSGRSLRPCPAALHDGLTGADQYRRTRRISAMPASETIEVRYMTYAAASRYAGLSARTLRRLIIQGKLKASRPVPQRVVIDKQSLDRYLRSCAVSA
jgi:excisionase family DNA binding protein